MENQAGILLTGPSRVSPFFIPMMIGNMAAGQISVRWREAPTPQLSQPVLHTNAIGNFSEQ